MCFLGLMAWAQRPSGAVSGVWRGVSECRRCQSEWAPHTSWKNSEQLGPECSLLSAGPGPGQSPLPQWERQFGWTAEQAQRADVAGTSAAGEATGPVDESVAWVPCQRQWLPGIGTKIQGRRGGRCERAGRWGSAAGAGSGRLWLEMLQASLGSTSTYNKKASFRSPSVHRGWATQVNASSATFLCPAPCPWSEPPRVPQSRTGRSSLHFLSLCGQQNTGFQLSRPENPGASLHLDTVARSQHPPPHLPSLIDSISAKWLCGG